MSLNFPALKPHISNDLWFYTTSNTTVPDENELTKEEEKFKEKIDAEVKQGQDIVPFGQTKQKSEDVGEDEDEVEDDDDSNEDIDEDTDEFDTASNGLDSIEDEMLGNSGMNETSDGW